MSINERVKLLRETLSKSQEQFGSAIGISKSGVSNIESGIRNVTEKHIKLICLTFPVNESWLRTGKGEMFSAVNKDMELEQMLALLSNDVLIKRIIKAYLNLDESGKMSLKKLIDSFSPEETGAGALSVDTSAKDISSSKLTNSVVMTDTELHAELDRQLIEEKKQAENQSAYWPGKSETAIG